MLCPVCAVDLIISDRQGIEIDYCPSCRGIWLDRGELDKLIERTAHLDAPTHTPYTTGKKSHYRGSTHHEREYDYAPHDEPSKPKRDYKGGKKHAHRGSQHYERDRDYDKRYDKRYRKKSKKRRASDLIEEIFDFFD